MNTASITPVYGQPQLPNGPWGAGEMAPGLPMPLDSPWVQSVQRMWPEVNRQELSKHASNLLSNMIRMLSAQIARDQKKARETAQRMRDAILGID